MREQNLISGEHEETWYCTKLYRYILLVYFQPRLSEFKYRYSVRNRLCKNYGFTQGIGVHRVQHLGGGGWPAPAGG